MIAPLRVALATSAEQSSRLEALQRSFAQVCNRLAPVVQERKLWHRVTLHHLMYRSLREEFPALGSQMVCNAIYSVCRTARVVYQNPASPFGLTALHGGPLPVLHFRETSPVYFDRHTATLKGGVVSLFTLEGRMHCPVAMAPQQEARFHAARLRELVLERTPDGPFALQIHLAIQGEAVRPARAAAARGPLLIPDYIRIGTPA
jgi:hypothetical protein